jgi:hypothetical protein
MKTCTTIGRVSINNYKKLVALVNHGSLRQAGGRRRRRVRQTGDGLADELPNRFEVSR